MHTRIDMLRLVLAALAVAGTGMAYGQIDVTPDGRLLDANPAVGGRGRNFARPVSPIMRGNASATGNLGAGMSLRSFSPIREASAFRGSLQSTSLSNFVRDSVSVGDAYRPLGSQFNTPFLNREQTTMSVGYLRGQGQYEGYRPGGSMLRNMPEGLNAAATRDYGQIDFRQPLRAPFEEVEAPWELTSSMFAATSLQDTPQVPGMETIPEPTWISEFRRPIGRSEELAAGAPRTDVTPWLPLDYRLPVASLEDEPARSLEETMDTDPLALLAGRAEQIGGPQPAERSSVFVDPSLVPGQSVFNDMQLALSLEEDPGAEWFAELREAIVQDPEMAPELQARAAEDSEAFVERMLSAPLRTFAGEGDDPSNTAMLRAEALMHADDYAAAAREYDKAALFDRRNPLPLIGKGHALLAAGDYRSAAGALLRGLELYPNLARFRVDLQTLLGGGEIVDIRRADLAQLLERNEDARLRFLLGYLEYHTGNVERGLENLDKAATQADFGSFIQRYPKLLKQGRAGSSGS